MGTRRTVFHLRSNCFQVRRNSPIGRLLCFIGGALTGKVMATFVNLGPFPIVILARFHRRLCCFYVRPLVCCLGRGSRVRVGLRVQVAIKRTRHYAREANGAIVNVSRTTSPGTFPLRRVGGVIIVGTVITNRHSVVIPHGALPRLRTDRRSQVVRSFRVVSPNGERLLERVASRHLPASHVWRQGDHVSPSRSAPMGHERRARA